MHISRPTKWLSFFQIFWLCWRGRSKGERGLREAAGLPEERELSQVLGKLKTGTYCCCPSWYYHHRQADKPFHATWLLQQNLSKQNIHQGPHLTQPSSVNHSYLSVNSLLKEEAVRDDQSLKDRKWACWQCGKECNQSGEPWQLWERGRCGWKIQWLGEEVEMRVKWLATAGQGKGKGCRGECELKGRPQISLCQREEASAWVCKQLWKDRCIGILCKSFLLLIAKGKFPWLCKEMALGLQKTKKIYGEILLLLNSWITFDCRVKQILITWKSHTHYLETALLKNLRVCVAHHSRSKNWNRKGRKGKPNLTKLSEMLWGKTEELFWSFVFCLYFGH